MKKYLAFTHTRVFLAIAFFLLGALVILGIRFTTFHHEDIHYHANFALYINGQREQFTGMQYYTETEMCTTEKTVTPAERAHMHDNVNDVVHVEDHAVTWGDFFANLGWTLSGTTIQSPDGTVYAANGDDKLHVVINGQDYTDLGNIANTVINDTDRLLVSYGNINKTELDNEYHSIAKTAHHYDVTPDPKTCSGHGNSSMSEKLHHLF